MRILSQEGLHEGIIDVPYEQVSIEQKENEIWCGYSSTMDRHCAGKCFAKYSTEEKVRKAMEMLHEVYIAHENYKKLDGDVQIEVSIRAGIEKAIMYGGIFQFPSDDEVGI